MNNYDQYMKKVARARHETVNGRFEQWGALRQIFRHDGSKHGVVMSAIVNITQIEHEEESPLFPIYYDEESPLFPIYYDDSYDVV